MIRWMLTDLFSNTEELLLRVPEACPELQG
jgi:hypothetical protein